MQNPLAKMPSSTQICPMPKMHTLKIGKVSSFIHDGVRYQTSCQPLKGRMTSNYNRIRLEYKMFMYFHLSVRVIR